MGEDLSGLAGAPSPPASLPRWFIYAGVLLFLLHAGLMLARYGQLPVAPVYGDEIIVNDASASLAAGNGYVASSFSGSWYGIDHLFAHFPPLYPLIESLVLRVAGFSVYSLRLTTTVMSIAEVGVLLALLGWLCRRSMLHPTTALACAALYSFCVPLVIRERMARMEAMLGLLVLLCVWALLVCYAHPDRAQKWLPSAAAFAGLCLSVHPEALSALPLLICLALLGVRSPARAKFAGLGLLLSVPGLIWVLTYRARSVEALMQLRRITGIEPRRQPGLMRWLRDLLHPGSLSAAVLDLQMILVLALLVGIVVSFLTVRLESEASWRLARSLAVGAALTLLFVQCVFGYDSVRYQFLVGPLLVALAVVAKGRSPLAGGQGTLVVALTLIECGVLAVYLHGGGSRLGRMDPDRYAPVIARLPTASSCRLLASSSLWLDLRTANRPFTVLYHDKDFDGERRWINADPANPLAGFDVVVLDEADSGAAMAGRWAAIGRRVSAYPVGGSLVRVYYDAACAPNPS